MMVGSATGSVTRSAGLPSGALVGSVSASVAMAQPRASAEVAVIFALFFEGIWRENSMLDFDARCSMLDTEKPHFACLWYATLLERMEREIS